MDDRTARPLDEPSSAPSLAPTEAAAPQDASTAAVHRGRLFRKYLLFILSLVTIALLASGGISLYFAYQEHRSALSDLQHEKALAAASRIEQYIRQVSQQLAFAALPQLDVSDGEARRIEFLKLLRQAPEITEIALVDPTGREVVAVSRLGMDNVGSNRDRAQDPAFRNARRGQRWFGPVYFRQETEPYVTISTRTGSDDGPVTVVEVNLKFIWEVVSRIKVGNRGKAYVVDASGLVVADPDIGLVLRKTSVAGLAHVSAARAPGASDTSAMVSRDLAGTAVLTSFATIDPLDWKVFVEQPVAEVYEKLDASILRTGLLLLAGFVISALAALALARSMVRPIRILDDGARRIAAGELDQRIEVHTRDELQGLAEQFNRMSARLSESYAGLEQKVEARTSELREALDRQTAISGVLRVISDSPTDVTPVLQAIADYATRLCDASTASIYLTDGEQLRHALTGGGSQAVSTPAEDTAATGGAGAAGVAVASPIETLPISRDTFSGRAVLDRATIQVTDAQADDAEFPLGRDFAKRLGHRTILVAPMLREERALGVILLRRTDVRPFDEREVALLQTFCDQAAIAIENMRLFSEIQEKSRQLEIANQHKSEFLANMSHELRTPLNAIIGFSEAMIERMFGDLNDKQDEYLRDIHSSGKHLLSLINDILDLSKIEAGRMELDVETFDARSALANAMTLVRERASRHGIALVQDTDATVGEFRADERKFKQILLNLLTNAVKFTPDGGTVTVHARLNGDALEVAVTDTGIGIAPEDQQAIFDAFRQVGRHYTNKQEGTGLGLALTRRFVELHGGTLSVVSALGQGSTFTFTLPRQA